LIYDAMVAAAAIEFADKVVRRPPRGGARRFELQVPVDDPVRWKSPEVIAALHDAVAFLTGDYWAISFVRRQTGAPSPLANYLSLPVKTDAILAFSDGIDSRAAAGIVGTTLGDKLVRVRVGSKTIDLPNRRGQPEPFTSVPYSIALTGRNKETNARTRGFKFALITAIAAYLTEASDIIIPESGQGAIGPPLLTVGHTYPDYRNHPLFTKRMARFMTAHLGKEIRYVFPRIWNTTGETLKEFVSIACDDSWASTKSCWRGAQWSSVNGKLRQCGVCAACMLRLVSVQAAGLTEQPETYVCTDMSATTLKERVDPGFAKVNAAFEHYAIAGALHMDHLADMAREDSKTLVKRHAGLLGPALGLPPVEAEQKLASLLNRHAQEWKNYVNAQGEHSFLRQWTRSGQ
jgi:7-cyano-7-deazaguanine synthase in queuosine biosynthesis